MSDAAGRGSGSCGGKKRTVRGKRVRRAVTGLLAVLLLCVGIGEQGLLRPLWTALGTTPSVTAYADELTNDYIREKEAAVKAAQAERAKIQESISDIKKLKSELEGAKANLNAYITQLDAQLTEMQSKIESLTTQIEETEATIEETRIELAAAEEKQESQYEGMKRRVKYLYEKGDTYHLEALLKAGSFSDLINRSKYVEKLSEYDANMLIEYRQQTELVRLTKEQLEEEEAMLEDAKAAIEEEQAGIEELMREKQAQIGALNGEIAVYEGDIAAYQAAVAQRDSEIATLEAAVKAEKDRLAAENQRHYGGGVFVWPAPSYTYISSEFGYRTSPTKGASTFHSGLDMASPMGSPILAAADGTVVAAAYSSSMGNYVMIDHGDGIYTIYMHASALHVSKGQEVSAGQQIAAVGSTGISTGPHLHFSVRVNGTYVNPWQYLR